MGLKKKAGEIRENAAAYKITYQDYMLLPEEPGCKIEVLDGVIIRDPSPGTRHQITSSRLQRMLTDYFASKDPEGIVFDAPLDVTLSAADIFQPDLIYVSGKQRSIVEEQRINGSPELLIEILSPGSYQRDRVLKMEAYRKSGVPHYWLVDPVERTIEAFVLRNELYALNSAACCDGVFSHSAFPGLEILLKDIWTD